MALLCFAWLGLQFLTDSLTRDRLYSPLDALINDGLIRSVMCPPMLRQKLYSKFVSLVLYIFIVQYFVSIVTIFLCNSLSFIFYYSISRIGIHNQKVAEYVTIDLWVSIVTSALAWHTLFTCSQFKMLNSELFIFYWTVWWTFWWFSTMMDLNATWLGSCGRQCSL